MRDHGVRDADHRLIRVRSGRIRCASRGKRIAFLNSDVVLHCLMGGVCRCAAKSGVIIDASTPLQRTPRHIAFIDNDAITEIRDLHIGIRASRIRQNHRTLIGRARVYEILQLARLVHQLVGVGDGCAHSHRVLRALGDGNGPIVADRCFRAGRSSAGLLLSGRRSNQEDSEDRSDSHDEADCRTNRPITLQPLLRHGTHHTMATVPCTHIPAGKTALHVKALLLLRQTTSI